MLKTLKMILVLDNASYQHGPEATSINIHSITKGNSYPWLDEFDVQEINITRDGEEREVSSVPQKAQIYQTNGRKVTQKDLTEMRREKGNTEEGLAQRAKFFIDHGVFSVPPLQKQEIEAYFQQEKNSFGLTEEQFNAILSETNPNIPPDMYHNVFEMFSRGSAKLDFKQLVVASAALSGVNGGLRFMFDIFDEDKSGTLELDEFSRLLHAILELAFPHKDGVVSPMFSPEQAASQRQPSYPWR